MRRQKAPPTWSGTAAPRWAAHLLTPRALGLVIGSLADLVLADPRRGHPVAAFGRYAGALEGRLYADDRRRGTVFTASAVVAAAGLGWAVDRATKRGFARGVAGTAVATWAVLGGTSLRREGLVMAELLEGGDLDEARARLRHLCARDPSGLNASELARASVESLAENVSDAVVAPLLWGSVAGVPGLLGYRAVNTLDAMVGYRSPRYLRFGWASARLDDALNLIPARVSGVLLAVAAPTVGGSPGRALRVMAEDGGDHPSPNAGRPEAAAAGALGITLGGLNTYHGAAEDRGLLGASGRPPSVDDIRRAARLVTVASAGALVVCLAVSAAASAVAGVGARRGEVRLAEYRRTGR